MDPSYTEAYEQFELRHWWFVARREIIRQAIARFVLPKFPNPRWLDIGCGTGVLLNAWPEITDKIGLEMDGPSVQRAKAKGLDVRQVSPKWDFSEYGTFDFITLTDVIEHVEHEQQAIDAVRAVLRNDGILLITVPALMSLWSGHDVVNRHFRRYTRESLLRLFPGGQWTVLQASYFSSLLLPLIWTARKWKNFRTRGKEQSHAGHDFKFGAMDGLLKTIFRLEKPLLRWMNLPLGSSVLLVLRKGGI
ncbi:MAG TPA: class I SAM-dependent methyltransferase [Tepidisphaeraceae bacterium]|jgi:SAM-dependent methyltransferase|nr:class I SAM-dependent methyltransferase [Tepidisphaeraceae bacterium]